MASLPFEISGQKCQQSLLFVVVKQKLRTSSFASFAAEPESAGASRRFVRQTLTDAGVEPSLIDSAELVASELVTNAVLHATTGPTVSLKVGEESVRLEVRDSTSVLPMARAYSTDAETGRGLAMVTALSADWGVIPDPAGKTVWAVIERSDYSQVAPANEPIVADEIPVTTAAAADDRSTAVEVIYRDVPVDIYLALEQHNEAMLRECELLSIQVSLSPEDANRVPSQVADLVQRSLKYLSVQVTSLRRQVHQAVADGLDTVDLVTRSSPADIAAAEEFSWISDETDKLSRQGLLLISPASEDVARLRAWFIDEMRNQIHNGPSATTRFERNK